MFSIIFLASGPVGEAMKDRPKLLSPVSEGILNSGRNAFILFPGHQSGAFKILQ